MKQKELEILGLNYVGSKAFPNRYGCTIRNRYVAPSITPVESLTKAYFDMFKEGIDKGKKERTKAFRRLINGDGLDD